MSSINIKYEGTNESHEMESLPKQRGEGSVTASDTLDSGEAAPRDADTLGGTITAETINTLNENLTAEDNLQFKFGKDGDGNYGYYGADGSLIPFKSGEVKELLWTNPNPTSNFSAQTISLDLVEYRQVIVEFARHPTNSNDIDTVVLVDVGGKSLSCGHMSAEFNKGASRKITVTTSGVTIGDSYENTYIYNQNGIPLRIYGIKDGIPSYIGEFYYNYYSENVSFIVPANTLCIIGGTLAGSSMSGDYFTLFDVPAGGYYGMKYIQTVSDVNITVGANKNIGIIVNKKFW